MLSNTLRHIGKMEKDVTDKTDSLRKKRNIIFLHHVFLHLMSYLHISTALFPLPSEVQINPERADSSQKT